MTHSVVVHAHLYQPPREDPWTGAIPPEATAAPFHDWNERIAEECYRPLQPLLDRLSFNLGATLSEWLDQHAPEVVAAAVNADRASVARLGYGNAMGMPYHHIILPLASRRDKEIEIRWGIHDFERRFGRRPEGCWLPETAVDLETLDVLAAAGFGFTVLAPHQVEHAPLFGQPGVVRTAAGRRISVFLYDGALAHEVAFGTLTRDPVQWSRRLILPPDDVRAPRLVSLATDGETFGHHQPRGIESLTRVLEELDAPGVRLDNYAAFLARHPPRQFVRLVENTSWSCAHGIERWRSDCGCRLVPDTSQAWRTPLRQAFTEIRHEINRMLAADGTTIPEDPALARETVPLDWHARRMFSSCAWFFDDIGGLESRLCLAHALRAIELAGKRGQSLLGSLRHRLSEARSNDPAVESGAEVIDDIMRHSMTVAD